MNQGFFLLFLYEILKIGVGLVVSFQEAVHSDRNHSASS